MKNLTTILLIICTLLTLFCFAGCDSNKGTSGEETKVPSTPVKTKQEIELENAIRLADEGAWGGAYLLFNDLIERGYYLDYQDERDAMYEKHLIADVIYSASRSLKQSLKNPYSFTIYDIDMDVAPSEYGDYYVFKITYDYGATNSFGGMVRDTHSVGYSRYNEADKYAGKSINYGHVNLTDIAKLNSDDWEEKMYGDCELYNYNLREKEGNLWHN